jgi:hypothetical protein
MTLWASELGGLKILDLAIEPAFRRGHQSDGARLTRKPKPVWRSLSVHVLPRISHNGYKP